MAKRLQIDISISDEGWSSALGDARQLCQTAAHAAFEIAAPKDMIDVEVSILLSDDEQVRELNKSYRGKDKPTNVLSFASMDESDHLAPAPLLLGDVVIAFGVTVAEANDEEKTLSDHLSHLVVHGMLHLLGHDHELDEQAEQMEALEIQTLAGLGIDDPYAQTLRAGML